MPRLKDRERLLIGVGGHIVAIDAASGAELWRTKLKGSMFVTIWQNGKSLYAGANGELFCIDADSGDIVWHNKLKGLGLGVVAFSGSDAQVAAALMAAQAAAAASSGS